ncbi:uncharacterized protein [Triticum aestivum]|uniref:uncharacterized protein n=1 Tax=Triticum aestivum TaxID=4565 RepID=UPI001D0268C5|nr:uncharacterized protein LOC123153272 [Triticum aestivum]
MRRGVAWLGEASKEEERACAAVLLRRPERTRFCVVRSGSRAQVCRGWLTFFFRCRPVGPARNTPATTSPRSLITHVARYHSRFPPPPHSHGNRRSSLPVLNIWRRIQRFRTIRSAFSLFHPSIPLVGEHFRARGGAVVAAATSKVAAASAVGISRRAVVKQEGVGRRGDAVICGGRANRLQNAAKNGWEQCSTTTILVAHGSGKNEGEHWEVEGAIRFGQTRVLSILEEEEEKKKKKKKKKGVEVG